VGFDLSSVISHPSSNYITLNGVRNYQFSHEVISIQCTVNDVLKFLEVDKNVQRELDETKVASIGQYIQYGLDGHDIYFSPLVFSARGKGSYHEDNLEYKLGMNERLTILDGQHRIRAFELLKKRLETASEEQTLKYQELINFPMTLQIFTNLTLEQERQLFTDINTKSADVNNTLLIMYKKGDLYGQLVREIIEALPQDLIECRAKTTRTKMMTASTLYSVAKVLNHGKYQRNAKVDINENNYKVCKDRTKEFITLLRTHAPIEAFNRDKYIIMSANIIVSIAKFIYESQEKYPHITMEDLFKNIISNINWTHKNAEFSTLSLKYNQKTKKYNFGTTGRTVRDFSEYLLGKFETHRRSGNNV